MGRDILIMLAVGAVWFVLRRVIARADRRFASRKQPPSFTPTVRCRVCGAYVDKRLARAVSDGYRCRAHDQTAA